MVDTSSFLDVCHRLLQAYNSWQLGQTIMPEDSNPNFSDDQYEQRLAYFSLPMALNYQRNSYTLRESALATYKDQETRRVFNCSKVYEASEDELRSALLKHKVALQPNKHINTRKKIAKTVHTNRWSRIQLLEATNHDVLQLQEFLQKIHKKWFPYLSGPKIFHYRCFILGKYGKVSLTNKEFIDIAPDTHIIQCSIKLWVLTEKESTLLSRQEISDRRRKLLDGTDITPIDMHAPLWFWSRNGFLFKV